MVMTTISVGIPARMHRELELLTQYYCEETFSKEHQEMVEDFFRATAEVVPDYDYD